MATVVTGGRGTCLEELCRLGMGSDLKDGLQAVAHGIQLRSGRCLTKQVPMTWMDLNPALPLKPLQLLCLSAPSFPIYKELMRIYLRSITPRLHSLILTKGFEILRWPVQEK